MTTKPEKVAWIDGLRGLGSLIVVLSHVAIAFDSWILRSTSAEGAQPHILQYPIIRATFQGRLGISIFSFITGYACALKPLRHSQAGETSAMLAGIAKSAFRRIPSLVLPASTATMMTWVLCQFGAFEVGNRVDSGWVRYTSPKVTPYMGPAISKLLTTLVEDWTLGNNDYDKIQWTLSILLKGGMLVYMFLVATAFCKARARIYLEIAMVIYYCCISHEATFGLHFFWGVFIADISESASHQAWNSARKWPGRYVAPALVLFGLCLASYPDEKAEWMRWSKVMQQASNYIFPKGSDVSKSYQGFGFICIVLGVHFSTLAKKVLSSAYLLWLGKRSFAVYLIHGSLLRWLLVWMYFGIRIPADMRNDDGSFVPGPALSICGRARFFFWLPIWFFLLYWLADLWTKYIEPQCAHLTQILVNHFFDDQLQPPTALPK